MALNPVERCLLNIGEHWHSFRVDESKRLLLWQVPDNALRMIECFFAVQKHESEFSTGDFFLDFDSPFEHSIQYSRELKETLAGRYQASKEQLKQQGMKPDWQFIPKDTPNSANGFVRALLSFGFKHQQSLGHLVVVLTPKSISDIEEFAVWLSNVLTGNIPERLRFIVVVSAAMPQLESLLNASRNLIRVEKLAIDTFAIAEETFAQENAVGPAGVFRNLLMGLVSLVEKASADQVLLKAKDAIAFTRKQVWPDQEVAIRVLVAGSLLKEKRFNEAVTHYQYARLNAQAAANNAHPVGQQLVLQTWFGEAGTHLAANNIEAAASCYDSAAALAQTIPNNSILSIEALRMAAFCKVRLGQVQAAFDCCVIALEIGKKMKPEARGITTVPLVAMELLRLLESPRVNLMETIKDKLTANRQQITQQTAQGINKLADVDNPQSFQQLEENHQSLIASAETQAAVEIESVAKAGTPEFRQWYAYLCQLLGQNWPLVYPIAIPRAQQNYGGATT